MLLEEGEGPDEVVAVPLLKFDLVSLYVLRWRLMTLQDGLFGAQNEDGGIMLSETPQEQGLGPP